MRTLDELARGNEFYTGEGIWRRMVDVLDADGYKIVPKKPTERMRGVVPARVVESGVRLTEDEFSAWWYAMLAAAPKPEVGQ